MKRLIAAAILGFVVIVALVADITVTNKVVDIVSQDIANCKTAAERGDYTAAGEYAETLEENWQKAENYFSLFINHDLIDNMGVSVSKLVPLAKSSDSMYLTECRVIEVTLKHIQNDSRFNLHNLL